MLVFDSSVALAILLEEPGYKTAQQRLGQAWISTVNIAEIATYLARNAIPLDIAHQIIARFSFQVAPLTLELAELAGSLFPKTKAYGLSLGDRACLALAISKSLPVLTADRVWQKLELPVEIQLLR